MEPSDPRPTSGDLDLAAAPAGLTQTAGAAVPALRGAPERREIALILGLVLLLNLLPGGYLQLYNLRWGLLVSQLLFILGPVFLALRVFYLDRRAVLPMTRPGTAAIVAAVLGALGLNHLLNTLVVWQDRFFPLPAGWRWLFESLGRFDGPADFVVLLGLLGVIPGICEEVLFRGYVQVGLRRAFGSGPRAVVVGALIFALFHLNPWRFDVLLLIGLYLGFLMERTGTLIPSMVAHATINMQSVLLSALGEERQGEIIHSAASHAAAAACLLAAALLLRRGSFRAGGNRI